jgi:DNA-binding transcriptional ArsR family regulator
VAQRAADSETVARFFHGLGDATRIEILRFLVEGPKTAGDIVRHIGRPQASVAAHVTCLRFCGYVEARRRGRNVWYELIDPRVRQVLTMGERYLAENAARIRACQVITEERDR